MSYFGSGGTVPNGDFYSGAEQIAVQTANAIGDQTHLLLLDVERHCGPTCMKARLNAIVQFASAALEKMN